MRVIWHETDIRPGIRYGSATIKEQWMIGYLAESSANEKRWVSISLMDGMVTAAQTAQDLAISLTQSGYLPECLLNNV